MREKNILWNEKSLSASKNLKDIIEKTEKYHVCNKFTERQGVITNNVVHMRTSFTNSENNTRPSIIFRICKRSPHMNYIICNNTLSLSKFITHMILLCLFNYVF